MYVLGLNANSHDTGAALITNRSGELEMVAIAEARLNRRSHSWTYPLHAIRYCLDRFGLAGLDEIDLVCLDRFYEQWPEPGSRIGKEAARRNEPYFDRDTRQHYLIEQCLEIAPERSLLVSHVDAHAASAYYPSGFDEAAIVILEGGGGIFKGNGTRLDVIDKYGYHGPLVSNGQVAQEASGDLQNIAILWDRIAVALGFDFFAGGKVMALAAYGDRHPKVDHLSLAESHRQFGDIVITHAAACAKLEALITAARRGGESGRAIEPTSEKGINICREAQEILQQEMLYLAQMAKKKTGSRKLCLAGGVALSCVTNRYIHDNAGFEDMFIQPAASDEGIALGCALHGYHLTLSGEHRAHMTTSYLGRAGNADTLEAVLERYNLGYRRAGNSEVAALLADGKIVGRVAGAAEYGPRALGNRSILADPRDPEMRDRINRDIKHRELFRPFAPSCHEDKRERYFDLPMRSPFMIMACQVKPEMRDKLPAVLHVDGSSRVQTVTVEQNPGYWELIEEFGKLTGIYVLLNTSFNDRGEPIVESYEDAIVSFCACGLDYLYVDGYLVEPPPHAEILKSRLGEELAQRERARYEALVAEFCGWEKLAALSRELEHQGAPPSNIEDKGAVGR